MQCRNGFCLSKLSQPQADTRVICTPYLAGDPAFAAFVWEARFAESFAVGTFHWFAAGPFMLFTGFDDGYSRCLSVFHFKSPIPFTAKLKERTHVADRYTKAHDGRIRCSSLQNSIESRFRTQRNSGIGQVNQARKARSLSTIVLTLCPVRRMPVINSSLSK